MGVDEGPIFSWAALTCREGLINLYPVVLLRNRVWREVSFWHLWRDRFYLPASFVYCLTETPILIWVLFLEFALHGNIEKWRSGEYFVAILCRFVRRLFLERSF